MIVLIIVLFVWCFLNAVFNSNYEIIGLLDDAVGDNTKCMLIYMYSLLYNNLLSMIHRGEVLTLFHTIQTYNDLEKESL